MRVLVTGSRDWPEDQPFVVQAALHGMTIGGPLVERSRVEFVVGDCPTGVDAIVRRHFAGRAEIHAADWDQHGKAAGPRRNQQMVDAGADLCLAFFNLRRTRGTADCAERARKAGIPVYEIGRWGDDGP